MLQAAAILRVQLALDNKHRKEGWKKWGFDIKNGSSNKVNKQHN